MKDGSGDGTVKFEYQQTNYPDWLRQYASATGNTAKDGENVVAVPVGKNGFSRAYHFENGFSSVVHNYQVQQDKLFIRRPGNEFGIIIHFSQFETARPIEFTINNFSHTIDPGSYNLLSVLNAQSSQRFGFSSGTKYKGVGIFLEDNWIRQNLSAAALNGLEHLKSAIYYKGFIQAKQQKLISEVTSIAEDHPYPYLFTKSRIYRLLDKMFEDFSTGVYKELNEKLSLTDFELLQKVESTLSDNFPGPFPSIEKLSKLALMSESKLKRLFKQAYGMGMYEYFQKNRLHKAKELLLAETHTITEVGIMLGYQNLSNFSAAFRKEFNCLPSEMGRQN